MTRLLIDTDVALGVWHEGRPRDIDDGFAIVEAINSREIDLVGVTCVFGNGPIDEVYRVAQELIALKEANVPVIRGAAAAMTETSSINPAVEFLAEALRTEPATIAAIGPLTNIGLLVTHYPELVGQIEELIVVGGRTPGNEFFIGDAGPVQDFNFEQDVLAAQRILASAVDCVLMGFELTVQVHITEADLQAIHRRNNPTADYFYRNSLAWCQHWTEIFPADAGFHPWDSAAIAWLLNRSWFDYDLRGAEIDTETPSFAWDVNYPGQKHRYCKGFTSGGAESFVARVISEVY